MREDKLSQFKTVIYDLSNESWYCNETPFTFVQIHFCQWISDGALVLLCRDFIGRLCFKCSDLFLQVKSSVMAKQRDLAMQKFPLALP